MDALSLKKLTKKYKELKKNNPEFFIKKIINYNYLNLSIHFSRDSREFDNINYQLLKYSRNLLLKSYKLYNKKVLKKILISYFNSFSTPVKIIRPFNTFGPRQSARAIIPTLISQCLNNKKFIKIGNMNVKRDFTYVSDVCEAYLESILSDKLYGEIFNIGNNK
ncbi:MAG: hypothetical protein CMG00_00200, partial [Candidatus Marinimicrobia bacterium]|nr:hypothetical protein [Candidatus Neomarinimicrobiota bacterium]